MKRYVKSSIMPLSNYDWKDLFELACDSGTLTESLKEIAEVCDASAVQSAILSNPNTTSEVLDIMVDRILKFVTNDDYDTLARIASMPRTSSATLSKMVDSIGLNNDAYYVTEVLYAIAGNSNTPLKALRKLSNCSDYDVRSAVAKNPNTSSSILNHLIKVDYSIVPAALVNPNLSVDMLRTFANSSNHWTRVEVAENSNTPEDVLVKLSADESYYVRQSVAENFNTPVETLKILAKDEEWGVETSAKQTLKALGYD